MSLISKLSEQFGRFPGIGPRQSRRFVQFLLMQNQSYLDDLSDSIAKLKGEVSLCSSCFRFFVTNGSHEHELCNVCSDTNRDHGILMVVEKDIDCENIERSRAYNGLYFILGGTVPILEKRANGIREKELKSTVTERGEKKELKEVIIAFSLNPDGEHTGDHVVKLLSPLKEKYGFTTTLFGRGLSTGSELEYSDSETIKNAFTTRR